MNLKVSVGLRRLSGSWKWNSGEPLSITHPMLSSTINNYDMSVIPCTFDYCGIFHANSFVDLRVSDNCCNNLFHTLFVLLCFKFNSIYLILVQGVTDTPPLWKNSNSLNLSNKTTRVDLTPLHFRQPQHSLGPLYNVRMNRSSNTKRIYLIYSAVLQN